MDPFPRLEISCESTGTLLSINHTEFDGWSLWAFVTGVSFPAPVIRSVVRVICGRLTSPVAFCDQTQCLTSPQFLVNVASKELSVNVSRLESTIAGTPASVNFKGSYVVANPLSPEGLQGAKILGTETGAGGQGGNNTGLPTK